MTNSVIANTLVCNVEWTDNTNQVITRTDIVKIIQMMTRFVWWIWWWRYINIADLHRLVHVLYKLTWFWYVLLPTVWMQCIRYIRVALLHVVLPIISIPQWQCWQWYVVLQLCTRYEICVVCICVFFFLDTTNCLPILSRVITMSVVSMRRWRYTGDKWTDIIR